MVELISWIYDFLTSTTDKKLDVIIRGIEILKTYAERNITNEEQRIKWETEVESWMEQIWDARVEADNNKVLNWMNAAGKGYRDMFEEGTNEAGKCIGKGTENEREPNEASAHVIKEFFANVWNGFTGLFEKYPPSPEMPHIPLGREDTTSKDSVAKGDGEKFDTNTALFQQISDKLDNLTSGKFSLVEEARADELTDADERKTGKTQTEGQAVNTKSLIDEMKLQKESLTSEIALTRNVLSETIDQVIFAREAVTTLQTQVATLAVVVNNLSLPKSQEPKINEYIAYQLDGSGNRA